MKLSEFEKNHSLHDSPINGFHYFPEQGKLVLDVDICDDGQWPFIKGEPDPFPISFVFTGVSHYSISGFVFTDISHYRILTDASLDFEKDEVNNERMLPSEKPEKEIIEFVLLTTSKLGTEGIKFLQIEAESVDWDIS